jgi:glycosyltransferase involved in cell wall biosynthesis
MTDDKFRHRHNVFAAAGFPSPARPAFTPPQAMAACPTARRDALLPRCLALIATRNRLPFAQITAQSFLAHHPDFFVFLLLVDGEPGDATLFQEGRVVLLADLPVPHAGWYAAKLTADELCGALKPAFLRHLSGFAETAIFLDSDTVVFSRLTEMIDLLAGQDMVLVPRLLSPPPRPEQFQLHPTRAEIFNAGLIDAGIIGLRLGACESFLQIWSDAVLAPGTFYAGAGYQTDQTYLNWALVNAPGAGVLRAPRYNVGSVNLHERDLCVGPGGAPFMVADQALATFRFTGYDITDRLLLSRADQRHSVYDLPAVAALLGWYSDRVLTSPNADLRHEPYGHDHLANGLPLNPFLRDLLKKYEAYAPRFDARTVTGADALCAFFMDPLPATGSMLPLVAAEIYARRPDLHALYPHAYTAMPIVPFWRWFCRHAGQEHDIQFLIDRFRRSLMSAPACDFAEGVAGLLGDRHLRFLSVDRTAAYRILRAEGHADLAETLLEARTEPHFFTELSAAFEIYILRPDLQEAFPDMLGRDHGGFADWLEHNAAKEHGCSGAVADAFRRHAVPASLARIFSYLARREDMPQSYQDSLLTDDPAPVLRDLIHDAGEGLEHTLEDVVLLRFVHQARRELLVPLYLELPLLRSRARASRLADATPPLLPEAVRAEAWALRGCEAHAMGFDSFEAHLDSEMRHWAEAAGATPRDVFGVLRREPKAGNAIAMVAPRYRAAVKRATNDRDAAAALLARLAERAAHPGVNIFGYFKADIGVGESARGLALAMAVLRPVNRVPLYTAHVQDGVALPELFQRFDYLSDTNVFVSYPHQRDDYLGMMRPEQRAGRRNVAHLAWEQHSGNPWWKIVYDRYDEIWTVSDFAATPFRAMFPDRVRVVPNVLDLAQFPACEEAAASRLKGERLKFLFAFDAKSGIERKNPEAVVTAFIKAFKDTPHATRASLILKVGAMDRPANSARLERLMQRAAASGLAIHFDGRHLSRGEMLRLIADADCYVSLHHAEGFGYTMAEAMAYGIPVIASGYSGNLEYMTPENSYLVPCAEAFVKSPDGPFQRGSLWGEPDIDAAVALLRQVAEHPMDAAAVGERGRTTVRGKLAPEAVAETMRPYVAAPAAQSIEAVAAQ